MTDFSGYVVAKGDDWFALWNSVMATLTSVTNGLEGMSVTSSTSLAPATGALTFTTDQTAADRPLAVGSTVRARSAADATKFAVGTVTAFSSTTLELNATLSGGSGSVTDWVIGYEATYQLSLALDPSPALAADLDAAGFSIADLLNLDMTGDLDVTGDLGVDGAATLAALAVTGAATLAAASVSGAAELDGRARVALAGEVATADATVASNAVELLCTSAPVILDTFGAADRTYNVGGAWTPGHEFSLEVRPIQDATGGRDVTVQSLSVATNSLEVDAANLDSGWAVADASVAEDVTSPAGSAWTITATGGAVSHRVYMRRGGSALWAGGDYEVVAAALLKAGVTSKARLLAQSDTYGHGGHADFNLSTGAVTGSAAAGSGSVLATGVVDCGGGWYVCWLAVDVTSGSVGGDGLVTYVWVLDDAGSTTYTPAGSPETILLGGACVYHGDTYKGFQNVGASRTAGVAWRDSAAAISWTGQAGDQASRIAISSEVDGAITIDDLSLT